MINIIVSDQTLAKSLAKFFKAEYQNTKFYSFYKKDLYNIMYLPYQFDSLFIWGSYLESLENISQHIFLFCDMNTDSNILYSHISDKENNTQYYPDLLIQSHNFLLKNKILNTIEENLFYKLIDRYLSSHQYNFLSLKNNENFTHLLDYSEKYYELTQVFILDYTQEEKQIMKNLFTTYAFSVSMKIELESMIKNYCLYNHNFPYQIQDITNNKNSNTKQVFNELKRTLISL